MAPKRSAYRPSYAFGSTLRKPLLEGEDDDAKMETVRKEKSEKKSVKTPPSTKTKPKAAKPKTSPNNQVKLDKIDMQIAKLQAKIKTLESKKAELINA